MNKAAKANKTLKAARTAASKITNQISRPSETTEVDVQHAIYDRLGSEFAMYDGGSKDNMQKVAGSLKKNVAGQGKAIDELTEYLRTGYSLARNPLAIVVLVSTGGAGKTEICEQLGEKIFSKIVHIDMAKYREAATATELFGSSRGYVDSHKGGILVNAVRHQPNTLILMENIDKAHPAIVSSITTALKTGGIKDGVGRTASLKDAMVVFTMNTEGSSKSIGFGDPKKKSLTADLPKTLPPDLLSVCKVVSLNTLSKKDVSEVFRIQIKKLSERVDREITYDDSILRVVLKEFDSAKGGRSVVDSVRKHIEPIVSDNPGYYPLFLGENSKGKIVASNREDISNG